MPTNYQNCISRSRSLKNWGFIQPLRRALPCSLCALRSGRTLAFSPSSLPLGYTPLPPLRTALAPLPAGTTPATAKNKKLPAAIAASNEKKLKLTPKERTQAETGLCRFGESVFRAERCHGLHPYHPRSSYFPSPMVNKMKITTRAILASYTTTRMHSPTHSAALMDTITGLRDNSAALRNEARTTRNANARAAAALKRQANMLAPPLPKGRKRVSLDDTSNLPPAKRATIMSVSALSASYGPRYRTTSSHRHRSVKPVLARISSNFWKGLRWVMRMCGCEDGISDTPTGAVRV